MRSLTAFWADVLFGIKPAPRCPVCSYKARGPRSLIAHVGRHAI